MARALWKGVVTFGLVSIPVELFPAEERKEFKFSMLDKRDLSPVGYKRYSKQSGQDVEWNNIVKGYEYEKDQYVVMSDEDFKRANVKASRTIEIQTFVADADISPEFFETPYYLVPGQHSEKVYALLRETLRSTGRIAVAQFVLRTTQHLVAVRPVNRALMLFMLRYPDELRGTSGFELPAAGLKAARVTSKEIELAKRLIDDMTEKWEPKHYKNTYHVDLMRRIKEKIKKGETKEITPATDDDAGGATTSNVIDLAALLQKSLGGAHGTAKGTSKSANERATKATSKAAPARHPKSVSKPKLRVAASSRVSAVKAKRA